MHAQEFHRDDLQVVKNKRKAFNDIGIVDFHASQSVCKDLSNQIRALVERLQIGLGNF